MNENQRENLSQRKEELERKLYRLLPELKPRIVDVDQVAQVIPRQGILVEYQRYQPLDGKEWQEARCLACFRASKCKLAQDGSCAVPSWGLAV